MKLQNKTSLPYINDICLTLPSRLTRLFYIVWFFAFLILFSHTAKQYQHKTLIIFLTVILYASVFLAVLRFRRAVDKLPDRIIYPLIFGILLLITMLLIWSGFTMCVAPFNDTGSAYYAAAEVLKYGHISREVNQYTSCHWATHTSNHDYFLIYPNNLFLVFYQVCYFKILSLFTSIDMYSMAGYRAVAVLNSVSIAAAVFYGVLTAKKCRGNLAALLLLFFSMIFVPYYLHAYKAYSDTLSIPYIAAALFYYTIGQKTEPSSNCRFKKYAFYILCGISLALAALIKGSALILFVAVIVHLILQSKPLLQKLMVFLLLFTSVFLILSGWSVYKNNCSWIDTSRADEFEFPSIHWVMMASVDSGSYRQSDFDYTQSFPTLAQKREANSEEFLRRVKSYGSCTNYLRFEIQKMAAVLADGKYAQTEHLQQTFSRAPSLANWLLNEGDYYNLFYCYITILITLFYFSVLTGSLLGIARGTLHTDTLLHITLFGVLLFFAFWEFKSRYLLNFVPVFMLTLVFSWADWEQMILIRRNSYQKNL